MMSIGYGNMLRDYVSSNEQLAAENAARKAAERAERERVFLAHAKEYRAEELARGWCPWVLAEQDRHPWAVVHNSAKDWLPGYLANKSANGSGEIMDMLLSRQERDAEILARHAKVVDKLPGYMDADYAARIVAGGGTKKDLPRLIEAIEEAEAMQGVTAPAPINNPFAALAALRKS